MRNLHTKNTIRYYIIVIIFLSFLFFSNDFGLIDVQKTAIVMAAGIDREGEEFLVTSQIAVPKGSQQNKSSEAVQLVSKGKTVAEAFEQINVKTGWYPKLVFCKLIILGKEAAEKNVFDALDFFLRDEYLTDDCQVAVCDGQAKELLNTSALVDPSSSLAISKVLSAHAERVGSVYPVNLKDFSIGYFGDSQSGLLPVLKTQPQQEPSSSNSSSSSENAQSGQEGGGQGSGEEQNSEEKPQDKPIFSAQETALLVRGRWLETLTSEETFALNAAIGKLRLASYSVEVDGGVCTLLIKHNTPKLGLDIGKDGRGTLRLQITLIAGAADYSKAQGLQEIKDMGAVPDGAFAAAEKKLTSTLITAYEKAKGVGCDVFGLEERLVKYKKREYLQHKDTLLSDTALDVSVKIKNVR